MKTYDVNIEQFIPLISPAALKAELPIGESSSRTVITGRKAIQDIIAHKDHRLLVITGPCSIHDPKAALDYAQRLRDLQLSVKGTLLFNAVVYGR